MASVFLVPGATVHATTGSEQFHIRGRGRTMLLLLLGFTKGRGISSIYIHLCKSNHLESDFLNHEMDSVFFSRTSKTSSLVWEQTRDLKGWFWNERRKKGFAGLGQDLGTWEPRWSRDGGNANCGKVYLQRLEGMRLEYWRGLLGCCFLVYKLRLWQTYRTYSRWSCRW